jgi:hypothetical protein
MSAKTHPDQSAGVVQWLLERGGEAAGSLLEDLLRNRAVTDGLTKTLRRAAQTKGRIDRNMQTLLALLNLPSRADYKALQTKLEALQGSLINLNMKLDRLLAATAKPKRTKSVQSPKSKVRDSEVES